MTAEQRSKQVEWYYAFCDSDVYYPVFGGFLKKGFGHVLTFSQTGPIVTCVEPTRACVNITNYFDVENLATEIKVEDIAKLFINKGFTVVKYRHCVSAKDSIIWWGNIVPSCVSLVKAVTGVKSLAQTPYQLYRALLKRGGTLI